MKHISLMQLDTEIHCSCNVIFTAHVMKQKMFVDIDKCVRLHIFVQTEAMARKCRYSFTDVHILYSSISTGVVYILSNVLNSGVQFT